MSSSSTYSKLFLVASICVTLASCVPTLTEVKDITSNRAAYSNEHFSLENISPEIRESLMKEKMSFKKHPSLTVGYSCQLDTDGGKHQEIFKRNDSYVYLGLGLSRLNTEIYKNDIAYFSDIGISYLGLIDIRYQTVNYTSKFAGKIVELKSIGSFPSGLANARPDSNYEFRGQYGTENQLTNFESGASTFKTKQVIPASQVFASLPGDAIMVENEAKNSNEIVTSRATSYYIFDYGVSIEVSHQSASAKRICTVQSIEIH